MADPETPYEPMTNSAWSVSGWMRQIDCVRPSTSHNHWRASCVQSEISARATKPSSRRTRAASRPFSSPKPSSTATRTRGTPVYGATDPFRLAACRPGAATAASAAAGARVELGAECGVFSNDFLIPLAFDRRLRHRGDLADRFGVLQVRVDRRYDDARFDGDQVDPDQRDADPCVDDNPLVEYS